MVNKNIKVTLAGIVFSGSLIAAPKMESLALDIIDIRSKIEALQTELATEKEKSKAKTGTRNTDSIFLMLLFLLFNNKTG